MAHLLLHHRCHHCFLLDLDLRVCSGSCRWVIWHLIARTINVPHSLLAALQLAASLWCATRGCGLALPRFITMQHDQEAPLAKHVKDALRKVVQGRQSSRQKRWRPLYSERAH